MILLLMRPQVNQRLKDPQAISMAEEALIRLFLFDILCLNPTFWLRPAAWNVDKGEPTVSVDIQTLALSIKH